MRLRPLRNKVLVTIFERGMRRLGSGIVLPNDDGQEQGIRPRWARIHAVGSDVIDVHEGDWALVDHGRWSRGVTVTQGQEEITVYQVDWRNGILATQSQPPDIEFE